MKRRSMNVLRRFAVGLSRILLPLSFILMPVGDLNGDSCLYATSLNDVEGRRCELGLSLAFSSGEKRCQRAVLLLG